MAEKQFGGWYPNPTQGGENMRWWGDYGWTTGSDPTGGAGPRQATPTQPSTQAPGQTPQGATGLFSQYQPRLAQATQQSEDLLRDYSALSAQAPTFQQKLLDAIKQAGQYPSHAELRAEYAENPNLTPLATEALVSRRGQATRGTIADLINRAVGGFQADVTSRQGRAQLAQQQRANLLEEYGFEAQEQESLFGRQQTLEASRLAKQKEARIGGGEDEMSVEQIIAMLTGGIPTGEPESQEPPPFISPPGQLGLNVTQEWPNNSGIYWEGDGQGGWR